MKLNINWKPQNIINMKNTKEISKTKTTIKKLK